MRDGFQEDWAFAAQGTIRSFVEEQFPHEVHRWPLLRTFNFDCYSLRGRFLAIVLRDKLDGMIVGGRVEEIRDADGPDEDPRPGNVAGWQDYLRRKLSVRPRDMVVVIPIKGAGPNVERDWAEWSDEERELWRSQIELNRKVHHDYVLELERKSSEDRALTMAREGRVMRGAWDEWFRTYQGRVFHVEVHCQDGTIRGGTAFAVRGAILATAAHNLAGEMWVGGAIVAGASRHARAEEGVDVATIRVSGNEVEAMPLAPELPTPGEEIAILGFASIPFRQPALGLYPGHVEVVALDYSGTVTFIQVDVPIAGSLSGSPVINRHGRVVGMVVERTFEQTREGVPGRGYSQVLPAQYLLDLLSPQL